MRYRLFVVITLLLLTFGVRPLSAQLKKVRFGLPAIAISEAPFKVAQLKGFYREEGLDVEMILVRGALGVQALLGGSLDYSASTGAVIAAGVRGLGVRVLLIVSSKPAFDLVSQPDIRSIQQLKGRVVGISTRGGSVDLTTQLIFKQNGLTPHKDVTLLVIGSQEEMMISLRVRLISAALLSSPRQFMLYREGFNQLAYAGNSLSTYPTGGIGATEEKIKRDPAGVLAFVKANLKGLQYYRQNRSESIEILSKYLNIKDPSLAAEVYDLHVGRLAVNGSADESWMRGAIDFTKETLGVSKEVPTNQVFDFGFIEKALR